MKTTEKALIGAMVGDPECIPVVTDIVGTGDFSDPIAGIAFKTIIEMFARGLKIDPVTVAANEGVDILYTSSAMSEGFWTNADQYAIDIARSAKLVRIKQGLRNLVEESKSSDILRGITDIYNVEAEGGKKTPEIESVIKRFKLHVKANIDRGYLGLRTGIDALESAMIYYVPGQIWAMGGYTSTGKTAMMVQMIVNIFKNNQEPKVCVVSTEMTEEQMVGRILGNMTGIYSQKIMSGNLYQGEDELYANALSELNSWNLKIHDDINELATIEATGRKHAMRGGMDVCFIDYVQNCNVKGIKDSYMEQKTLATSIQQLAKTTNSTMVCLSQVSNAVGRGMVDTFELKGAGEWAAVADIGIMLKRGKTNDRELAFSAPKNRHGTKPSVIFKFKENYANLQETGERVA